MSREGWVGWKVLATESFVVFVGLVGALQVDQWRDQRELAETETVYLHRLDEDLTGYREWIPRIGPAEPRATASGTTSTGFGATP